MARVIRMQGFKDWKDGLITTKELLAGKVYREAPEVRKMWEQIIARATGNWENVTHHPACCCNECAPTELDKKMKIDMHHSKKEHDLACCCDECLDDMERGMKEMEEMLEAENLAPSDCEPE